MKLRALILVAKHRGGGHARPGELYEEHDLHGVAAVMNGHAEPVDGDSVEAARARLAAADVHPRAPLGGGVRGSMPAPNPWRGWRGSRGPLEQAAEGE